MNFGTPVPLLLGILMVLGAVALFFLDKFRPGYEREYDKVYAVLFLISGIFFLGQLTMELIPSFQQIIMVGLLISLTIQNIRARKPGDSRYSAQAAPDVPLGRDSYRPSRSNRGYANPRTSMQAELDRRDIPPDRRFSQPMLSGYEEREKPRPDYNRDNYPRDDYPRDSYQGDSYQGDSYQKDNYQGNSYQERYPDDDPPFEPNSRSDQSSSYSGAPRSDVRLRRRRPSKFRDEGTDRDRYRLGPGDSLR
ncbi:MAG TPA: Ycf66 family protein [Leptolyngbyaceae cyanobacterium]